VTPSDLTVYLAPRALSVLRERHPFCQKLTDIPRVLIKNTLGIWCGVMISVDEMHLPELVKISPTAPKMFTANLWSERSGENSWRIQDASLC